MMEYLKKAFIAFFFSVILTDSVFKRGKNYCPQMFLEKCKRIVRVKKVISCKYWLPKKSSDDSDKED